MRKHINLAIVLFFYIMFTYSQNSELFDKKEIVFEQNKFEISTSDEIKLDVSHVKLSELDFFEIEIDLQLILDHNQNKMAKYDQNTDLQFRISVGSDIYFKDSLYDTNYIGIAKYPYEFIQEFTRFNKIPFIKEEKKRYIKISKKTGENTTTSTPLKPLEPYIIRFKKEYSIRYTPTFTTKKDEISVAIEQDIYKHDGSLRPLKLRPIPGSENYPLKYEKHITYKDFILIETIPIWRLKINSIKIIKFPNATYPTPTINKK